MAFYYEIARFTPCGPAFSLIEGGSGAPLVTMGHHGDCVPSFYSCLGYFGPPIPTCSLAPARLGCVLPFRRRSPDSSTGGLPPRPTCPHGPQYTNGHILSSFPPIKSFAMPPWLVNPRAAPPILVPSIGSCGAPAVVPSLPLSIDGSGAGLPRLANICMAVSSLCANRQLPSHEKEVRGTAHPHLRTATASVTIWLAPSHRGSKSGCRAIYGPGTQRHALLGREGIGKTTLLRVLAPVRWILAEQVCQGTISLKRSNGHSSRPDSSAS